MKVRDYINHSVAQVNTQLKEIDLVVDVSESIGNNTYSISYQISGATQSQTHFVDSVSCLISFYFKSNKGNKKSYDDAFDLVRLVRNKLLSIENFNDFRADENLDILSVGFSSLTVTPLEGSTKTLQVDLSVSFEIAASKC